MKDFCEQFNSVTDFFNTVENRKVNKVFENIKPMSQYCNTKSCCTKDFEEAKNLLFNGDVENFEKIKRCEIKVKPVPNEQKKVIQRGYSGFLPSIPLYLQNNPKCMFSLKKENVESRVINVYINNSVPYSVESGDIVRFGAAISTLINTLELNKIRINLFVVYKTTEKKQNLTLIVKIKKADAPLNKLAIAYPLINPSFLRRNFTRWIERIPIKINKDFSWWYGRPCYDFKAKDGIVINAIDVIKGKDFNPESIYDKYFSTRC